MNTDVISWFLFGLLVGMIVMMVRLGLIWEKRIKAEKPFMLGGDICIGRKCTLIDRVVERQNSGGDQE